MTPKHLASKQWAAVRVRLAARLLYCFGCGASWDEVVVGVAGRLVGHTAGQVEMCSCSPWAMRLYLAVLAGLRQRFSTFNQAFQPKPHHFQKSNHENANPNPGTIPAHGKNKSKRKRHTDPTDSYSPHRSKPQPFLPCLPHQRLSNPSKQQSATMLTELRAKRRTTHPIPISPNQLLPKSRHQLPRMTPYHPPTINQHSRVPQQPHTNSLSPLVEPDMTPNIILGAGLLDGSDFGPVDGDALGG